LFLLSPEGVSVVDHFESTDIDRTGIDRPLSSFIVAENKELKEAHRAAEDREDPNKKDRRRSKFRRAGQDEPLKSKRKARR
jgi:hypothetical protein